MTRVDAFPCLQRSDENTIGWEEVGDSCSLCEKFRVGKDIESAVGFRVGFEDGTHGFGGTTWYSWFFNHNFGRMSNRSDAACSEFYVTVWEWKFWCQLHKVEPLVFFFYILEICCEPRSYTTFFSGRVDADKDKVSLLDPLVDVGWKEEVTPASRTDNVF